MLLGQSEAIRHAAKEVATTWSGAVLVIFILTGITMAWWFILRVWGKDGFVVQRQRRDHEEKDRIVAIMETMANATNRISDTQRMSHETCQTHVERLDKLVQVSERACDKQCETVELLRANQQWHQDPRNPKNVLSVHDSVKDLAEAGELFIRQQQLPQEVHDNLVALFQRIRSRAEQNR